MAGWQAPGYILSAAAFGESGLILSILTDEHGRTRGLVRGAAKSRQRGMYEPGTLVAATWNARLAEQLGGFRVEPMRFFAAEFMDDPLRLACLGSAAGLADQALPEQERHAQSFLALSAVLDALSADEAFLFVYLRYELVLLAELGFGLDLARCGATGATRDLAYVSPRTGRAVSLTAGEPYKARLLRLPRCLGGVIAPESEVDDLLSGLDLTGHFLGRHVTTPAGHALPPARDLFVTRLRRLSAA